MDSLPNELIAIVASQLSIPTIFRWLSLTSRENRTKHIRDRAGADRVFKSYFAKHLDASEYEDPFLPADKEHPADSLLRLFMLRKDSNSRFKKPREQKRTGWRVNSDGVLLCSYREPRDIGPLGLEPYKVWTIEIPLKYRVRPQYLGSARDRNLTSCCADFGCDSSVCSFCESSALFDFKSSL